MSQPESETQVLEEELVEELLLHQFDSNFPVSLLL